MKARNAILILVTWFAGGVSAQVPHAPSAASPTGPAQVAPLNPPKSDPELKALEECVGAEKAKTLMEQFQKRTSERVMKTMLEASARSVAPSQDGAAAGAENRYNECIKRENPDLRVPEDGKAMPCAAEYQAKMETRGAVGQERRKNIVREFTAASLPLVLEDRAALIAELKQLCTANSAK